MSLPEQTFWQRVSNYFVPTEQIKLPLPVDKLIAKCQKSSSTKRVVLVACGSFNPPTIMHLRMFDLARDHLKEEGFEVVGEYLSPVNDAYAKPDLASASKRTHMARECAKGAELLEVDEWEALQPSAQRSLTVLNRIQYEVGNALSEAKLNTEFQTRLLCGSDLLESMLTPGVWIPEQISSILRDFGIACISRDPKDLMDRIAASPIMGEYINNISIIEDAFENNLSSSLVRKLIFQGKSVRYLVPDGVLMFIEANKLYQ